MTSRAFRVVEMFEEAMAEYAGSRYGVAVDSCTTAIFLGLLWELDPNEPMDPHGQGLVGVPKHTYVSVPSSVRHAGYGVKFQDREWEGAYRLDGTMIIDSALRMRKGMYQDSTPPFDPMVSPEDPRGEILYCVSFHARKHIKIGRGGMVLTDRPDFVAWAQQMRFDGRHGSIPFPEDWEIRLPGLNAYMTPEQAARGLQLLEALPDVNADIPNDYPDLSQLPVFKNDRYAQS